MIESLHVQDREEDLPPSAKKPRIACGQCQVETSKYTCPKCELRTCSLTCSAQHKTERHCDGIRPPFVPVQKFSQFNETTSVKDQEFLHAVQSKVYESKPATSVPPSLPQPASFVPQKQQAVSSPIKQENGATAGSPSVTSSAPQSAPPNAHVAQPSNSNEFSNLTPTEKYLLQNCHRRRVWLTVNSREEADGSRHEQFSDTVYWTIRMKFMRHAGTRITTPNAAPALQGQDSESREDGELDSEAGESELRIAQSDDEDATDGQQEAATNEQDGVAPAAPIEPTDTSIEIKEEPTAQEERDAEAVEEHSYTVKNIPESLTVNTLLRQFVRPKIYGPVISRGDLDADKMAPFIEAGMEHVAMYMRVPVGPNERYYIIDKTKTILENLRNRFVIGHPEFIVTLDNDFMELPTLSESEAQDLQTARREDYKQRMSD
ncbi:HIT zinc finger family protein, partial [Aphelenchoides avenae]